MNNTDEWLNVLKEIHDEIFEYKKIVEEKITIFPELDGVIEKTDKSLSASIKKVIKEGITFNSTLSLMKVVSGLDAVNNDAEKIIMALTDLRLISDIKTSLSDSYYNRVLQKNESLRKKIATVILESRHVTDASILLLKKEDILKNNLSTIENAYFEYKSVNVTRIFTVILAIFRENKKDLELIENITEKMKDLSLGYKNEKYATKPYSKHPISLQGLTFNLVAVNSDFIPKPKPDPAVCQIFIDNTLKLATNMVIYKLQDLLHGNYSTVNRNHSINANSAKYSATIQRIPVEKLKVSTGIEKVNTDADVAVVYETQDSGKTYRKMSQMIPTSSIINLDKGPKPRVFLYPKNIWEAVEAKRNVVFLNKKLTATSEYSNATSYMAINNIKDMLNKIDKKHSNKMPREAMMLNYYRAQKQLEEVRLFRTSARARVADPKIQIEEPLVSHLI